MTVVWWFDKKYIMTKMDGTPSLNAKLKTLSLLVGSSIGMSVRMLCEALAAEGDYLEEATVRKYLKDWEQKGMVKSELDKNSKAKSVLYFATGLGKSKITEEGFDSTY